MDRVKSKFGGTQYSRRREQERERKILEFQMAIQRQGRSLRKLMAERDRMNISHYERREEGCVYQHKKSMKRREMEYQQAAQTEKYGNVMNNNELDYLQSSHYEKYLDQIMAGNRQQPDSSKKIDMLRPQNIYLQQHFIASNPNMQQKKDKDTAILEQKVKQRARSYNNGHHTKANNNQIIKSKVQSPSQPTINCLPYLENSSILEESNEEKSNKLSGVSTASPTCWNEPLRNIAVFKQYERKSYQDLYNVNTVVKQERHTNEENEHTLRPTLQVNSQAKQQRNNFIENILRQQKENKQKFLLKKSQARTRQIIKYQRQKLPFSKIPLERSNLSQTNQRQIYCRPSILFTEDTKKKQDHFNYTADFKIEEPEKSRIVVKSISVINFDKDRSQLNKILINIKMLREHESNN